MEEAKPCSTPAEVGLNLSKDDDSKFVDPTFYRSFVGSLMYLTATRPDITYGVSLISKFIEQPKKTHWEAGKRILRYVRGTLGDGLYYQKANNSKVLGYCDSDWAASVDDSKSTSENVFFVGSCAIKWISKKQQVVALSTAEAKYISLSLASCQALWITRVLEDLKHAAKESPIIYCDSKSMIALTKYPVFHGKSKHIRIKYHFIRDLLKKGEVVIQHCESQDQIGDIFTKPLRSDIFKELKNKLGTRKSLA
ncbi:secreted RxLR effector protein 161-like [Apium graveolens]|uniref:secreted RxLR effector protein 161-like n=1 Tax=Apium graveolens TaxID=4045 RepID=UPI003D7B51F6